MDSHIWLRHDPEDLYVIVLDDGTTIYQEVEGGMIYAPTTWLTRQGIDPRQWNVQVHVGIDPCVHLDCVVEGANFSVYTAEDFRTHIAPARAQAAREVLA